MHGKQQTLLVDGMWRYGRKIHYVMNIIMVVVCVGREPHASKTLLPAIFHVHDYTQIATR